MKVSLKWLKRYVDLDESPKELAASLTLLGFEVDDMETTGVPPLENVVVGEVLQRDPHPDADKLGVCRVDCGPEIGEKSIVCGASNYKVGDRVPVALPGAELPGGFKIKESKLRGVPSAGMMCGASEIGASGDDSGLLILDGRPELGTPINQVLTDSDTIFNLEVTPNRPDCLSHIGIARELAAWYRRDVKYPEVNDIPAKADRANGEGIFKGVSVDAEEDCPLYIASVIKGVKVGPSPKWLQEALTSIGLRPINNVVDVTNFVMHECGNPMHAFDARDIDGGKIVVRHAGEGEAMHTLDGEERKLSSRMVVIADQSKALAVAGVMGGQNSEVKEDTTDLVLEVAYFKPSTIRWVSKKLALSTDSSYRFERGVDPLSLRYATERAISLILETAGGQLCSNGVTVGNEPVWQTEVEITPDWIRKKSGFDIGDAEIREALELLDMSISVDGDNVWTVSIPSYRGDLYRPVDLLEEVLRIYGTDKIPGGQVRATATTAGDSPITQFNRKAASFLIGQNFAETVTYTLRSAAEQKLWAGHVSAEELALLNPISEDQTQLRHSLLPGMLEVLHLNQSRKTGANRFFETGRVFRELNGKVVEMVAVAFLECNGGTERSWKDRTFDDFYAAKQRIKTIAGYAGIDLDKFKIREVCENEGAWQEGHSAAYEEPKAGFFARVGLMSLPRVKEMDIQGEVFGGIFCYLPERLREPKRIKFKPFSLFPASSRDLALVVDKNEPAEEVVRAVSKIASKATKGFEVEKVSVFDVYEGVGVPEGKKSVAVTMSFRALDRTLKDKEVNKAFETIQNQVRENSPYSIRD
ncbi:phenylalanine--tRNA ligase subunit beta [Pelagicoccus sp. SDUM812005]|uniref:phenylalanine--tRNA ligase subunit beta n=1 Tax=Pelagicoccus sp. SDUM812005 TaxID=3041257 RepID=UPI00280D86AD|nr:phenylalanine--tRNA ligase subunit beta [Pelagicoccus sp. SDUM812005]MDQ8179825.1 phenylalanine--tRNA ligase subunit beta [Pelagicoccus sp. SDUM812005]